MTAASARFLGDDILPDDSDLVPIHDREYRVRAYRLAQDKILIRGAVRDQKPPGLYISHDPEPITVHHMVVELEVGYPTLTIERAQVVFQTFPHSTCSMITDHYRNLEGLSIARGFSNKVRELFGGPRGCTHTTALLLAMGPVAVQCAWSMRTFETPEGDAPALRMGFGRDPDDESWKMNIGTCHEWAEGGPAYRRAESQGDWGIPVFMRERAASFGLELGEAP
ncbi:MAG: DUF2889 domain-containing protein [Ilumatobacteraceae bacterium]